MTSSTSFSRKFIFLIGLLFCSGCTGSKVPALPVTQPALSGNYRIALLPVENLSGAKAPVRELRQALADKLRKGGVVILPDDLLTQFMTRHRLRYTGGIDDSTAEAFREEAHVDAVLITSLELYNAADPPKIALTARLVSAAKSAEILWMESAAMAGNDPRGLFDPGITHAPAALGNRALGRFSGQPAA